MHIPKESAGVGVLHGLGWCIILFIRGVGPSFPGYAPWGIKVLRTCNINRGVKT